MNKLYEAIFETPQIISRLTKLQRPNKSVVREFANDCHRWAGRTSRQ